MFKVTKTTKTSFARIGVLKTAHGKINTPFFMPVATQGSIKLASTEDMRKLGAQILLSNTYHLMLRPGEKLIKQQGGLHKFMNWDKPILTDSGGYQVFSLAQDRTKTGQSLVKLSNHGAKFKSYLDGKEYNLTPEKSLQIQTDLGVDIAVCLDECVALPATKQYIKESIKLTTAWAERTKQYHQTKLKGIKPLLFAVVQGGLDKRLREESLQALTNIGFDGYNIGGLSVGETPKEMYEVLDWLCPAMPADKPRYLMGVGYPENIIEGVKRGVDMFDCVIPTREGRHGRLFIFKKNAEALIKKSLQSKKVNLGDFYIAINITNAKFAHDKTMINLYSDVKELQTLSKAYLHHLYRVQEPLGQRLATLNNLEFYLRLMELIRKNI
jgi:queuine tRNA-ribosyltransferase